MSSETFFIVKLTVKFIVNSSIIKFIVKFIVIAVTSSVVAAVTLVTIDTVILLVNSYIINSSLTATITLVAIYSYNLLVFLLVFTWYAYCTVLLRSSCHCLSESTRMDFSIGVFRFV